MDSGSTPFLGLAPFLRVSIAGVDLKPFAQEMLAKAQAAADDANLLMNLSTAMLCLGQRQVGLSIQAEALAMARVYHLAAARRPARLRLLLLLVPGDLAANAPLDCLLEDTDVDLDFCYLGAGIPAAEALPPHDAVMVAISEADDNRPLLAELARVLVHWPRPVINRPQFIPATERQAASALLRDGPGLLIPPTLRASRAALLAAAAGQTQLAALFDACDYPVILRPVGSHAGHGLDRIANAADLAAYLAGQDDAEFFLSPFVDYRGEDGFYRKMRIALIDGRPYACHMAVSSHWMIHYVNAGMYEDAGKRAEEAAFMAGFDDFARRHGPALEAIHRRSGLDYLCVDCAEAPDGRLLVFEIDHAMVVHAMDPEELFPYKQVQMHRVRDAFRDYLLRLTAPASVAAP
jgi:hypothetical protein